MKINNRSSFSFSFIGITFFWSSFVHASFLGFGSDCPESPKQSQLSPDVSAGVAIPIFKEQIGKLEGSVAVVNNLVNLYEKYPNADRIVLAQMVASLVCRSLESDNDISAEHRVRITLDAIDSVSKTIPSMWITARSNEACIAVCKRSNRIPLSPGDNGAGAIYDVCTAAISGGKQRPGFSFREETMCEVYSSPGAGLPGGAREAISQCACVNP